MSSKRSSFLFLVSVAMLAACGGQSAPTSRPAAAAPPTATVAVTASANAATPALPTLSATPTATAPLVTSSPAVGVTSSPVAAGGALCPVAIEAADLGTEFDKY